MVKKYRDSLNITSEKWLEMLNNKEVFKENDLQLIKVVLDNSGKIPASEIAGKIGKKSHGVLNLQLGRLSKRIIKFFPQIEYPKNDEGNIRYWHIPFLGEDHPKINRYYWELRPELEEAAKTYFYSDSTEGIDSVFSLFGDIPAIRLLPMSESDPEFTEKSIEEVQGWFKIDLPGRKYQYKRKMNTPEGTLVLFQYQGHLIAAAILEEIISYGEANPDGYNGYYYFSSSTIALFDPLSFGDVQEIWNELKSFNQSSQKLDANKYSSLKSLLSQRNFRFVVYADEEDFQKAIENNKVGKVKVEDQPKELGAKVSKASENLKWGRDPTTAKRAIVLASHNCEADSSHNFFISFRTGENYVEAHHLIPMEFQYKFQNSLDIEANIISLCAMCHKKVHHAQRSEKFPLIEELFENRRDRLQQCGIPISFAELKDFY